MILSIYKKWKIMRRSLILIMTITLLPLCINAQEKAKEEIKIPVFNLGFYGGVEKGFNNYSLSPNNYGNNFYSNRLSWNIGIDYSLTLTKKWRARTEFRYLQTGYSADWQDANITVMDETNVKLYDLGLGLHGDYLLLNSPSFVVFVSPGVIWKFTSREDQKNIRQDGSVTYAHYNGIYNEHKGSYLGGSASMILKYNVSKNIGIKLVPEYSVYVWKFIKSNDKIYSAFRTNLGVEFNFY